MRDDAKKARQRASLTELIAQIESMKRMVEAMIDSQVRATVMAARTEDAQHSLGELFRIEADRRKIEAAQIKADIKRLNARLMKLETPEETGR